MGALCSQTEDEEAENVREDAVRAEKLEKLEKMELLADNIRLSMKVVRLKQRRLCLQCRKKILARLHS